MEYNQFDQEDSSNNNNVYISRKNMKNQKRHMQSEKKNKKDKRKNKKASKLKIIFLLLFILLIVIVAIVANNYNNEVKNYKEATTNLIINSNNVTKRLKHDVIIKNKVIYVSIDDVKNFFDKYIEVEESINKVITTGEIVTAEISFKEGENIKINGVTSKIQANAIKENNVIYLPLSEMLTIYNIQINYIEATNIITVDSINKELEQSTLTKNSIVREKKRNILSNALEKLNSGDKVYVISDNIKGWTKVRTLNGKIGYLETKTLSDYNVVQEEYSIVSSNNTNGKINMFWDYFSEKSSAPDRTGQTIEGVNVVSPTFFYIDKNGNLKENIGTSGKKYIEWAKSQNYQIWPRVSNDLAGIEVTSKLLNNYSARQKLISDLVNACMVYNLDGVNIDFEYMYQNDKDAFSKLIIEMVPIMKGSGS